MNSSRLLLAAAVAASATGTAHAGALYFDFNRNTIGDLADASLFLFGDAGQTATVDSLAGFSQTVTLGADGFFDLAIDNSFQQSGTGIRNTGFRVSSADPIAGYFINRAGFSTDMTYLFDEDSLGTDYVVASQGGGFGEGSQVAIHATRNDTTVTFTPTSGSAVTVTLDAGETYKYAGGGVDLTGSTVQADKAVAVFSGHECANVPIGTTFCDTLVEQMISSDNLSTSYRVTASDGAARSPLGADLVRVIGTEDGTTVTAGGTTITLNRGEVFEFQVAAGSGGTVEASAPVMVAQYLTGGSGADTDPAMALVPGTDTWLSEYRLATPSDTQAFDFNYASIVIPAEDLASLRLNGLLVDTSGFSMLGTDFMRGIVDLPLGLFDLTADNPFLVMLGGGSLADSYFTFGGATFAPGVSPPADPVPEPGALVLLAGGGTLLALRRRTARRSDRTGSSC